MRELNHNHIHMKHNKCDVCVWVTTFYKLFLYFSLLSE
jgi:hypothetical protein